MKSWCPLGSLRGHGTASCEPRVIPGLGGHRATLESGGERDHLWQGREWDLKVDLFFFCSP